ncbi:hypothetical protein FEM48_Zijuj04G0047600 [Ziziphus jujuba var. spinosa]|uniref:CSC1-like protein HYP1 n=1 Tax=Ziziphus jujuba var. spinosa TaxID=714518 RepID=A0A978VHV9_ZIZJJ|nr:hypothetical protein FEM48_Zijuj04G0047600 [Ziziphus jujuba var. spinosa]
MILSALLTSVGINLGLCLLFFTLYSILRKQPGNVGVYAPRLVAQGQSQASAEFNLERLLPTAGWVRTAWQPSEEHLFLKVFTFAGIVGVFVLIPVNFLGNQLSEDISDLPNKSLDSFSISNVNVGSNRLWIHFCAAYVFTGVVCYFLYCESLYISSKRIAYFYSCKPQAHQFTVLVRGIPVSPESSCGETVERFFTEYHPSTYLSHTVLRRTSKVQGLISDAEKIRKRLAHLKLSTQSEQRFRRDGFLGIFGRKVDIIDHYERKLGDLEDNLRMEQSSLGKQEVPAAFVSFKSRLGAAIAFHIPQGVNPTEWVAERAPEPQDVHWPFFSSSFIKIWIFKLVVVVACVSLTILFLIPVLIVQGLTNLEQLETWFPFLESILKLNVVSQVITGYLPSLILHLFLSLVPPIMIFFSSMQGYMSFRSALYQVNIFLEPKKIPKVLAEAVPSQAAFFIAYVVTSGWTSLSSELFRLIPLICSFFKRLFAGKDSNEFDVPSTPYHSVVPRIVFFGLLGVTYFFLAPLILPFLIIYYCMGYIIYRNQLLNVYSSKYETGGKFWPIVHNSMIFSLILMHVIAIGIFGLKKLPLASSLIIPLPILTLLFDQYIRRRFLPIFKAYPVECLVNKDRADENDPAMAEFFDKLVSAYRDPALDPLQYSRNTDGQNAPLLGAAEV